MVSKRSPWQHGGKKWGANLKANSMEVLRLSRIGINIAHHDSILRHSLSHSVTLGVLHFLCFL